MSVKKTVKELIRTATQEAEENAAYCPTGTCRQAVLRGDEIIRTDPQMNCPEWVMQVAAAMFIRAADEVQLRGGPGEYIQNVFYGMASHAHKHGMNKAEAHRHFDVNRVTKNPRKDRS